MIEQADATSSMVLVNVVAGRGLSAIYAYRNVYSYHAAKIRHMATTPGTDMVVLLNDVVRIDIGEFDVRGPRPSESQPGQGISIPFRNQYYRINPALSLISTRAGVRNNSHDGPIRIRLCNRAKPQVLRAVVAISISSA
jgi:hypothetical protein